MARTAIRDPPAQRLARLAEADHDAGETAGTAEPQSAGSEPGPPRVRTSSARTSRTRSRGCSARCRCRVALGQALVEGLGSLGGGERFELAA